MKAKIRVCLVAIFVCALLAAVKYFVAISSGSITLKADALHSLLDMMTSSLVLFTVFIGGLNLKGKFVRTLPKIFEILVFITIIGLVTYFGFGIFRELKSEVAVVTRPFWVILLSIISIIISHYLYRYQRRIGREENNVLILADAFETRMDQISSLLVVFSVLGILMGMRSENTFVLIILGFISFNIILWTVETIYIVVTNGGEKYKEHSDRFTAMISKGVKASVHFSQTHKKSFKYSVGITALSMLLVYILSGVYTIRPGQVAVVQYFGKHIPTMGINPGLNYSFPWPFSTKEILNVDEIKRISVSPNPNRNLRYYITKDENLIDISISMQYRVSDINQYVFSALERTRIVEDLLESTTTATIGKFAIDDALVHKKQIVLDQIRAIVQAGLKKYKLGIHILNIQFKNNRPPREVIMAFNDVSSAREDKRTYMDKAQGYKNQVLPDARGRAFKMIQEGKAFAEEVVLNSEGDSEKLKKLYREYVRSPYTFKSKTFLKLVDQMSTKVKLEMIDPKAAKNSKIRVHK